MVALPFRSAVGLCRMAYLGAGYVPRVNARGKAWQVSSIVDYWHGT